MRAAPLLALLVLVAGCAAPPPAKPAPTAPALHSTEAPGPGAAPEPPRPPAPAQNRTNWSRPHVHDLWGSQRQMLLMHAPVDVYVLHNHAFDQPPREFHTHGCDQTLVSSSQGGSVVFTFPPGTTVVPGTARLEVELLWDTPAVTGLAFRYRSPDTDRFVDVGPVAPHTVVAVPLTRPMADLGHEVRSRWDFALCAKSANSTADVADGTVLVTITAFRVEGALPVDPGHPDVWRGNATLALGEVAWDGARLAALGHGNEDWKQLPVAGIVPWDATAVGFSCDGNLTAATDAPVLEAWASPPDRDREWAFQHWQLNATGPGRVGAVVDITPNQADGVYANQSHWMVWFRARGERALDMSGGLGSWAAPALVAGAVTCRFAAVRGPAG